MKIVVFYITCANEAEANSLGQQAVELRLAACANIHPINSIYFWENKLQHDQEYVLSLKTLSGKINAVNSFITMHHSYQVPCILHWEAEVNDVYGKWVEEQVR